MYMNEWTWPPVHDRMELQTKIIGMEMCKMRSRGEGQKRSGRGDPLLHLTV